MSSQITQSDLARYIELQTAARRTAGSLDLLRKNLLRQHELHEPTEPGPLMIDVVTTSAVRFSAEAVAKAMGFEVAEELKTQIEPSISRTIKITENPEYVAPKGPVRRSTARASR